MGKNNSKKIQINMSVRYVYQNKRAPSCSINISTVSGDQESWNEFDETFFGKFDNGDAFPQKIFYTGATFDKENRIFKGTLDFGEKSAGGICKWIHQFQFNEAMTYAVDGFASGLERDGKEKYRFSYGRPEADVNIDCGKVVKSGDLT